MDTAFCRTATATAGLSIISYTPHRLAYQIIKRFWTNMTKSLCKTLKSKSRQYILFNPMIILVYDKISKYQVIFDVV